MSRRKSSNDYKINVQSSISRFRRSLSSGINNRVAMPNNIRPSLEGNRDSIRQHSTSPISLFRRSLSLSIDNKVAMPNNIRPSLEGNRDSIRQHSTSPAIRVLPEDIMVEILLRLPARHLLRLRPICKAWNAIICDEGFAKRQHNRVSLPKHAGRRPDSLIIRYSSIKQAEDAFHLVDLDAHGGGASKIVTQLDTFSARYTIVGSCNGVLLLRLFTTTLVWNPLQNKYMYLPTRSPGQTEPHIDMYPGNYYDYSFGYDSNKSEFKVVRAQLLKSMMEVLTIPMTGVPGPWRTVGSTPWSIPAGISFYSSVNNRLHWLAGEWDNPRLNGIISFDLRDEQFHAVPTPWLDLNHVTWSESRISELRGCLSIFRTNGVNNGLPIIEVWVMQDYDRGDSWTLWFSLNCNLSISMCERLRVVKCDKDEILIGDGSSLVAYNYTTQIFDLDDQMLGNHRDITSNFDFGVEVVGFVGSLASPESFIQAEWCVS